MSLPKEKDLDQNEVAENQNNIKCNTSL